MPTETSELQGLVETHAAPMRALTTAVERVVVGQSAMVTGLLTGLLTGGHVLLEGVPGLAKTLTVSTLAKGLHAEIDVLHGLGVQPPLPMSPAPAL